MRFYRNKDGGDVLTEGEARKYCTISYKTK